MDPLQIWLLVFMVVCGGAVIGSYIHGFSTHPGSANKLWGGVTGGLRRLNYVFMLGAAVGYFLFTYWLLFPADPAVVQVFGGAGYWMFFVIFAFILIASALWMPFLFAYLDKPTSGWWFAVRLVLVLVGLGSLALLVALLTTTPAGSGVAFWLAVVGAALFSIQTAVMDMLIWPVLFKRANS